MVTSWVLLIMLVVSLVILLMGLACFWKKIPPLIRWISGLNALILLVNIMSIGFTIEQQNDIGISDQYSSNQMDLSDHYKIYMDLDFYGYEGSSKMKETLIIK
jgi:energy-coupling factor transporter transmembrane protein EcfT